MKLIISNQSHWGTVTDCNSLLTIQVNTSAFPFSAASYFYSTTLIWYLLWLVTLQIQIIIQLTGCEMCNQSDRLSFTTDRFCLFRGWGRRCDQEREFIVINSSNLLDSLSISVQIFLCYTGFASTQQFYCSVMALITVIGQSLYVKEALTKRRLSTLSWSPLPASCLASKFIKSVEAVVFVLPPLDHRQLRTLMMTMMKMTMMTTMITSLCIDTYTTSI